MTVDDDAAGGEIPDAEPVDAADAETQEAEVHAAETGSQEPDNTAEKPEGEQAVAEDAEKPDEGKQKARTRDFIDRLKQEKREAEKRAKEAEAELAKLKVEKPKREDFDDDDDYQDARHLYRERQARREAAQSTVESARAEAERVRFAEWQQRVEAAKDDIPDIEQVITDPRVNITQQTAMLLMESDYGPQVAYKLARNPSLAAEIARMSERDAARAIGRLEAEASPQPRKISSAPPPVDTVTTRGAAPGFDPARASVDDLAKMFRQGRR